MKTLLTGETQYEQVELGADLNPITSYILRQKDLIRQETQDLVLRRKTTGREYTTTKLYNRNPEYLFLIILSYLCGGQSM